MLAKRQRMTHIQRSDRTAPAEHKASACNDRVERVSSERSAVMAHAENSVTIERPIGTVFDFVLDGTKNALWRPAVITIERVAGAPAGGRTTAELAPLPLAGGHRGAHPQPTSRLWARALPLTRLGRAGTRCRLGRAGQQPAPHRPTTSRRCDTADIYSRPSGVAQRRSVAKSARTLYLLKLSGMAHFAPLACTN
jgi:hypothetical protein